MGWKEDLPEEVQGWDEVKNAETPEAFFKQLGDMRSSMGQMIRIPGEDASAEVHTEFNNKLMEKVPGLVRLPGEDADAEALKTFYKATGAPESLEGYKAPEVEGADVQPEMIEFFKQGALEANLTQKQFEHIAKGIIMAEASMSKARGDKLTEDLNGLKQKWGQAFDEKRGIAEQVRRQYFSHIPEGDAIGAATIAALAAIGEQLGAESQGLNNTGGQQRSGLTPDEAQLKISEIMNNKDHAYWNKRDPAHMAARKRMRELHQAANPA